MKRKNLIIALLPMLLASCNGRNGNSLAALPKGAKEATKESCAVAAQATLEEINNASAFGFSITDGSFSYDLNNTISATGVSATSTAKYSISDLNFNLGVKNLGGAAKDIEASATLSFKVNIATKNSAIVSGENSVDITLNGEASAAAYFKNNTLYVDYSSAATKQLINTVGTIIGKQIDTSLPSKFKISDIFSDETTTDDEIEDVSASVTLPEIDASIEDSLGDSLKFYTYENGGVGAECNLDSNTFTAAVTVAASAASADQDSDLDEIDSDFMMGQFGADASYSAEVRAFSQIAYLDSTSGFFASDTDFTLTSTSNVSVNAMTFAATSVMTVKDSIRLNFLTGNKVIVDSPIEGDYPELETDVK